MKFTSIVYSLMLAAYLPAQTSHPVVVVVEKNVMELQKVRGVIVVNGDNGLHSPPEVDSSASAEFAAAVSKQLEQLTCWKLLPPTKRPGETSTSLMTDVEYKEVPHTGHSTPSEEVFQFTVADSNGTLWDGSKRVEPPLGNQRFYTAAQIQSVVEDMLGALAADACPGAKPLLPASFDCAKAVMRAEKLICGSPELSNADGVMAAGYRKTIAEARAILPAAAEELKRDQLGWIKENAACEDATCLQRRYGERLAFLYAFGRVTAAGGAANDEPTVAFLKRYPWRFRLVPRLMKDVRGLLGDSYREFEEAMGIVHVDDPGDPSAITGNMRQMNCAVEAIVSVNGGGPLAVAVTVGEAGDKANVISVFSQPRVKGLAELPEVKSWVEGFQHRCGKREVKLR